MGNRHLCIDLPRGRRDAWAMACICRVPGCGGFSLMRCYLRAARNVITAFSRAIVSSRSSEDILSQRPGCAVRSFDATRRHG